MGCFEEGDLSELSNYMQEINNSEVFLGELGDIVSKRDPSRRYNTLKNEGSDLGIDKELISKEKSAYLSIHNDAKNKITPTLDNKKQVKQKDSLIENEENEIKDLPNTCMNTPSWKVHQLKNKILKLENENKYLQNRVKTFSQIDQNKNQKQLDRLTHLHIILQNENKKQIDQLERLRLTLQVFQKKQRDCLFHLR